MKTRNGLFADVPENLWNDWHWQVANRAETVEDLKKYTTPSSRTGRMADISQDSMFTQQMERSYSLPPVTARAASITSTGLVQSATITSV